MPTRGDYANAMRKAYDAGDEDAARTLAAKVREFDTAPTPAPADAAGSSAFRAIEHDVPGALSAVQRAPTSIATAPAPIADMPPSPPPPMTAVGDTDMGKPIAAATPVVLPRTPQPRMLPLPVSRTPQAMDTWRKRSLAADAKANDPTLGMSTMEKLLVGNTQQATDAWLASKQFANTVSGGLIGDKAALAAEAAEKAKYDAPLLNTGAGFAGSVGGRLIPEVAAMTTGMPLLSAAGRGIRVAADAIPMMPKVLARAAQAATPSAIFGATASQLNPSETPGIGQIAQNALVGGGLGVAGEGLGRVAGRALAPFHGIADGVTTAVRAGRDQAIQALQSQGMLPKVLASHILPGAEGLTMQLSRVPGFNRTLLGNTAANEAALTAKLSGAAGSEGSTIGEAAAQMRPKLNEAFDSLRDIRARVKVGGLSDELLAAHKDIAQFAETAGQTGKANKAMQAGKSLADQPGLPVGPTSPGAPASILRDEAGAPLTPAREAALAPTPASEPQTRSVADLIDLRNAASEMAHSETSPKMAGLYRLMRDKYRTAAESAMTPEQKALYGDTLTKWGRMLDFERSAVASGVGSKTLDPTATFHATSQTAAEKITPTNELDRLIKLHAEIAPGPHGAGAGVMTDTGRVASALGLYGAPAAIGGAVGAITNPDDRLMSGLGTAAKVGGTQFALSRLLSTPWGASYLSGKLGVPMSEAILGKQLTLGSPEVLNLLRRGGAGLAVTTNQK